MALRERPRQELQNEPPLDIAVLLPQNPFMASLIQTWSIGWPESDFGGALNRTFQVRAPLEALDEGAPIESSDWACITPTSKLSPELYVIP